LAYIFKKYIFGIIPFIGLCLIGFLNYYSSTKITRFYYQPGDDVIYEIEYVKEMAFGYYFMYIGCVIIFISAILLLAANLREKQLKGETYAN
jgi:TRAP-type C4-dicarboxylate transport system permease small subunit